MWGLSEFFFIGVLKVYDVIYLLVEINLLIMLFMIGQYDLVCIDIVQDYLVLVFGVELVVVFGGVYGFYGDCLLIILVILCSWLIRKDLVV